ncbi:MAG TPA: cytochrome C oxidase subunit IV family protein [Chryseosolibacter sp.]|nr:cytochrome C oxidase subunit IV family protein [Chryseosolibacter sp.]
MASTHHEETQQVTVIPPDKEKIRKLWRVAGILGLITAIEFAVAFLVPHEFQNTRVWLFIAMTIVKAAYIVGEFMHLRHEAKVLIWAILIPMIFVVWLLIALVYEGMAISDLRF